MEIKNISAIVSGGASGMGEATARALSKLGAKVAIFDININNAQKISKAIGGLAVECDITSEQSVMAALQTAKDAHGDARICINCAGIVNSRRMVDRQGPMPLADYRHIIEVNLLGTLNLMRLAAAHIIPLTPIGESLERGIFINTASISAYDGQIGQTAYSAAKGGIVSLTLPAAREFAQFGIRVMTIAPGLVDTPMFENLPEEARLALTNATPFPKRLATPGEFSALAIHIIQNPMLNGEVIRLDGALRMPAK